MMLALKRAKEVKPPNGDGLECDMDDATKELISKGLITADLLTTPAPVCVRMCPDFTAATFAHGNCTTPAEIRRKFRNEKRQDNVLAYVNLDAQLKEIQNGVQKVLNKEAWYVQYTKNCEAEFGSDEKRNSHGPNDEQSLKKSRKSVYNLVLGGNVPVEFRKPTIPVLRVPDDECMRLNDPAQRPKLGAPFNAAYVKLNQEYFGLDSSGTGEGEAIAALRIPDDKGKRLMKPAQRPKLDVPFKAKPVKLNQEDLGSDSSGTGEAIAALRVPDDEFTRRKKPAQRKKLDVPFKAKPVKFNQEDLGLDSSGSSTGDAVAARRVPDDRAKRLKKPAQRPKLNEPFKAKPVKFNQVDLGLGSTGTGEAIAALRVPGGKFVGLADPAKSPELDASFNAEYGKAGHGLESSDTDGDLVGVADVGVVSVTSNEAVGGVADLGSGIVSDDDMGGEEDLGGGADVGSDIVSDEDMDMEEKLVGVTDAGSDSVSDEGMGGDEEGFDFLAPGTADDLFPEDDFDINPAKKVRVRSLYK